LWGGDCGVDAVGVVVVQWWLWVGLVFERKGTKNDVGGSRWGW
jgi:hypothetical protein